MFVTQGQVTPFEHSRAGNSKVSSRFSLDFKLILDFMSLLVITKFDEDLIKMKALYQGQHLNICPIIGSLWENFSTLKGK